MPGTPAAAVTLRYLWTEQGWWEPTCRDHLRAKGCPGGAGDGHIRLEHAGPASSPYALKVSNTYLRVSINASSALG